MDMTFDRSPYQRWLGVELVRVDEGEVALRLPFKPELLRLDGSDWLHGGVVSALVDIACAYAVISVAGEDTGATVDLRIDWLQPARQGELSAVGRVVRQGRRLCVADAEVFDAQGDLVAVGRGTFLGAR